MGKFFIELLGSARLLRLAVVLVVAIAMLTLSATVAHGYVFWEPATHEIGFALLVSFIVWSMFEFHRSQEAESEWTQRIERVTRNVFFAVLGKDLPKPLIDEARALALDADVLRSNFNVTYTLRDAKFQPVPGEEADCVLMVAVIAFEMTNVSREVVDVPIGVSLPNPVHPALRALTKVNTLEVRTPAGPAPLDLVAAEAAFREQLGVGDTTAVLYKGGTVRLSPGETLSVRADYVMAKEPEDTELLQTLYPCDGLTVTVMDADIGQKRTLFAKSVHRRRIENQSSSSSPGTKIFRISGYLLPHQGVLIWWKRAA